MLRGVGGDPRGSRPRRNAQPLSTARISSGDSATAALPRSRLRRPGSLMPASAARRSSSTGRPRADKTSTIAVLSPSFLSNGIQAGVTLPLEQIPEHHLPPDLAIVESLDRHRVREDSRRLELFAEMSHRHTCPSFVHLDSSRPGQAHHPDIAGAGGKEILDLGRQLGLVLPGIGVLHRQERRALNPTRLVRDVADGKIRSPKDVRGGRKTRVDTHVLNRRIAGEHVRAHARRLGSPAAGGQTVDGMAVQQLVRVAGPDLIGTERT